MKRLLPLLFAVSLLVPGQAAFALTDRADLEKWCQRSSAAAVGRCYGYLRAAADVLASDSIDGVRACLPRDIELPEMHRLLRDWLSAHPAAMTTSAMGLVARALAARYPCPK